MDLFLVETIFDTLNAKAALYALERLFEALGYRIPVMVRLHLGKEGVGLSEGSALTTPPPWRRMHGLCHEGSGRDQARIHQACADWPVEGPRLTLSAAASCLAGTHQRQGMYWRGLLPTTAAAILLSRTRSSWPIPPHT